ncbi:MAG: nitroreductase [Paenibacillus sp.]|nr:nitroreductase [Paenibacillus sp.]
MDGETRGIRQTIVERRTIRNFNGKPHSKEAVLELLDAAVWAPYHSAKEPWRFILFMEDGRSKFADAVRITQSKEMLEKWSEWIDNQYCSLMQAHLVVVIKADPRQREWEEALLAGAAFIQNLQLLAWDRQIGVVWKTHDYNWDPKFHRAIGVKTDERVAGTLHLGYFDKVPRAKARTPVTKLLTYWGE